VAFFKKWGMLAVFVGRFFGPFRAVVPLIAGLNAMPWLNFQIANVASAAVWAAGILLPGFIGVRWLME
jgi:membrane protein DedA with SNARE-associated domain